MPRIKSKGWYLLAFILLLSNFSLVDKPTLKEDNNNNSNARECIKEIL